MTKFFHEAPNSIFHLVQQHTDGDYCLVHLLEHNETYRNLFKQAVNDGREVILDNSIFELGESYDPDRYAYWIDWLKPTWYIIPDVLEDMQGTINNLDAWVFNEDRKNLPGKKIAVVQGRSVDEIQFCYNKIQPFVDMVAISFDYSFFENQIGENQEDKWMRGRQRLIFEMNKWVNRTKPHHLLGTALPQEGIFYKDHYPWIYSIDTSNPVVHGLYGIRYKTNGLEIKERMKLADMIDEDVTSARNIIVENIEQFKRFWQ